MFKLINLLIVIETMLHKTVYERKRLRMEVEMRLPCERVRLSKDVMAILPLDGIQHTTTDMFHKASVWFNIAA